MIHQFGSSFTFENVPRGVVAGQVPGGSINNPISPMVPVAAYQLSDAQSGRVPNQWEQSRVEPGYVEDSIDAAFHYLDAGMKAYWSDIRVPSKDSYRFARAKVAGMRTSLQVWTEDLKHGRVKLPVISISRTGHTYNPQKFSPPYRNLHKRFVNRQRTMAAAFYRPVPYNVNYTISIWAEHKRDAEYVLYQMLTRFNPLAELRVSDGISVGCVQMKMDSSADSSEKEATSEQYAKVKYEVVYTAEAWLSIPPKIMPVILGKVVADESEMLNRRV